MVHTLEEHFDPAEADEKWIAEVGKRDWIVITKDRRIRYRQHEKMAVKNAGVALFVLVSSNQRGESMADALLKAVPRLRRFLDSHDRPFIAKVYRDGTLSLDCKL